jgi:hypothetical protein
MDDQSVDRDSGEVVTHPTQFSLRSLFVVATWASIWLGAWGVMAYLNRAPFRPGPKPFQGPIPAIILFTILYASPYAVFGYIVGRPKLGIGFGIVVSALTIIMMRAIAQSAIR